MSDTPVPTNDKYRVSNRFKGENAPVEVINDGVDPVEYFDDEKLVVENSVKLARLLKESKHAVIYTGAGVSTSAGIPDFRGPRGLWTVREQKLQTDFTQPPHLVPTQAHMAISELVKQGFVKYVVSTNCDCLHIKSGLTQEDNLSEIHGNSLLETCYKCKKKHWRDFPVRNNWNSHKHETERICDVPNCGGELLDTIVNFGEDELEEPWNKAVENCSKADLIIVLGSSLRVRRSCELPIMCFENNPNAKLAIVNLQNTPHDSLATVRIHARTDQVLEVIMNELKIDIPPHIFTRTYQFGIRDDKIYVEDVNGHIATVVHGVDYTVHYNDGTSETKNLIYRWDDMQYTMKVDSSTVQKVEAVLNFHFKDPVLVTLTLDINDEYDTYSIRKSSHENTIEVIKLEKQRSNCSIQ